MLSFMVKDTVARRRQDSKRAESHDVRLSKHIGNDMYVAAASRLQLWSKGGQCLARHTAQHVDVQVTTTICLISDIVVACGQPLPGADTAEGAASAENDECVAA